jgi:LysM repeat protein
VRRGHDRLARFAAPAAFLLAATIAILIVRSGLDSDGGAVTPVTTQATTAATTTEPTETRPPGSTTTVPAGAQLYEIQPGDTLALIAEEHDTSVEQLLVLNPDIDPVALTVGQQIRVK